MITRKPWRIEWPETRSVGKRRLRRPRLRAESHLVTMMKVQDGDVALRWPRLRPLAMLILVAKRHALTDHPSLRKTTLSPVVNSPETQVQEHLHVKNLPETWASTAVISPVLHSALLVKSSREVATVAETITGIGTSAEITTGTSAEITTGIGTLDETTTGIGTLAETITGIGISAETAAAIETETLQQAEVDSALIEVHALPDATPKEEEPVAAVIAATPSRREVLQEVTVAVVVVAAEAVTVAVAVAVAVAAATVKKQAVLVTSVAATVAESDRSRDLN